MTDTIRCEDSDDDYLAEYAEEFGTARQPTRSDPWQNGRKPLTRREASIALRLSGPFLYAARMTSGTIKFGFTAGLLSGRIDKLRPAARQAGERFDCLLAIRPGTRDDEQALHRSLAVHVRHGREWYHPAPEVLAVVNEWRSALKMDPIS